VITYVKTLLTEAEANERLKDVRSAHTPLREKEFRDFTLEWDDSKAKFKRRKKKK
jgi:hypothetical protein